MRVNSLGYINYTSIGDLAAGKPKPINKSFERSLLWNIRKFGCDHIIDTYWLDKLAVLLKPNELLTVKDVGDGYYKLSLINVYKSKEHYICWCEKNALTPNNAVNLRRFVKEVRYIWI